MQTDLVNTRDICPTILEVAHAPIPKGLSRTQSLLPLLLSSHSGKVMICVYTRASMNPMLQVEDHRDAVISERHVSIARQTCLGFPVRSIRTQVGILYSMSLLPQ